MQGYLNLFTTEDISIDKTQALYSMSYESACIFFYIHFSCVTTFFFLHVGKKKKRNEHPKPTLATADGNDRLRKSHQRCCPELCKGQWQGEFKCK